MDPLLILLSLSSTHNPSPSTLHAALLSRVSAAPACLHSSQLISVCLIPGGGVKITTHKHCSPPFPNSPSCKYDRSDAARDRQGGKGSQWCHKFHRHPAHPLTFVKANTNNRGFEGNVITGQCVNEYYSLFDCMVLIGCRVKCLVVDGHVGSLNILNCQLTTVSLPSCEVNHSSPTEVIRSHIKPKPETPALFFILSLERSGKGRKLYWESATIVVGEVVEVFTYPVKIHWHPLDRLTPSFYLMTDH